MRKFLILLVLMLTAFHATAQITVIPDPAFEAALIAQGIDSDGVINGQVLTADISGVVMLNVPASNISSLTGIEDFAALEVLDCSGNPALGTMDISQNLNLLVLDCSGSNMTALDVSNNLLLEELHASDNMLTALDVSSNAGLRIIQCSNNQITGLDVTNSALLEEFFCDDNALEGLLDLSQNSALTDFSALNNSGLFCIQVADAAAADAGAGIYAAWMKDGFAVYSEDCSAVLTYVPDDAFEQYLIDQGLDTQLDNYVFRADIEVVDAVDITSSGVADLTGIEDFAALEELYCSGNSLTSLDVSQNTSLLVLECSNNQLAGLALNTALTSLLCDNNQLTALDVSQNLSLNTLDCSSNQLTGSLLVSGLTMLTSFNAVNNPILVCIQVDNEVDATAGAGQYATWSKDAGAFYSEDCAMSSENFSMDTNVVVYPNPAAKEIHLQLPYQIAEVAIYNMQGQEMMKSKSGAINIEKLPEGLYFVIIQTPDRKRFQKKIVVSCQ